MRIGIIGGGYGADVHLPVFRSLPEIEVVAVADGGSGRMAAAAPDALYFKNWMGLLDCAKLDAVSIVTPPNLHQAIVEKAIDRDLHILCEKPFGLTLENAQIMTEQASVDRVSAVNYQFRFDPMIQILKHILVQSTIGNLRRIDVHWSTAGRADPSRQWGFQHDESAGGGVINAFLSHIVDYVLWLTRLKSHSIWGRSDILIKHRPNLDGKMVPVTAEDSVDMILELEQGVLVSAHVTNCQPGRGNHRIVISGDSGQVLAEHTAPFSPNDLTVMVSKADGHTYPAHPVTLPNLIDSRQASFSSLVECFLNAANGNLSPDLPLFADALSVRRVLHGLKDSVGTGTRFMILPPTQLQS